MLVELAVTETRHFTASEDAQFSALMKELDQIDARIRLIRPPARHATCTYCNAAVNGERCRNCGAPSLT